VIADVWDKGAPAAFFMARTKTLIQLVATLLSGPGDEPPAPHEIIAPGNQELCRDNAQGMFVTCSSVCSTRRVESCGSATPGTTSLTS
jgi:phosphoserine phosphatase RsbU/P